jgi:uncharacterized protein (TIGR00251 family)
VDVRNYVIVVKPSSRKESVQPREDGSFLVRVNAPPVEGKANTRAIELLADHFGVPKSRIHLQSGARSRRKIIRVQP